MTRYRSFGEAFDRQTPERPISKSAYLLKDPATEGRQRAVERFNARNRQETKWRTPKPFLAMPYGERVAIEVLIPPLVDWLRLALGVFIGPLQHKFDEEPQKPPKDLRPLIVEFNDYKTLALMGLSPLMECMTWDWDDPSADAKLKLKVGAEMEAQLAGTESWDEEQRLRNGSWLALQVLALDLFDMTDNFPKIAAKYQPELDRIREEMIRAHPVHMPVFEPPPDWTSWWMKCPGRLRVPFVRRDWWPEHREVIAECLKDPNWEPAKAVNALQSVPFLIDPVMRDLVKRYGADVMGHEYQQRWDDERTVADDIRTAGYIGNRPFYIPRNVDKRGRINSVCHFNFDRGDHVRSMFRFARGMQLDRQDPTEWLEIHCANCHGETDKRPYDERRKWADDDKRELIQKIADDPEGTFELWMSGGADPNGGLPARAADLLARADRKSKFCFVAACRELAEAWKSPATFETRLPIGFDGSCNGLQHLALIARDPETARMVNAGPSRVSKIRDPDGRVMVISTCPREPQDVYTVVVAQTKELLLLRADEDPWASWWLDRFEQLSDKHTRKLIKTPAMTYAYAATQGTMAEEILDVYRTLPCANSHPSYDGNRPKGRRDGCSYLAGKIIEACRELLKEPTRVMEAIQDFAQRCTDRGLFLNWMTPSGFWVLHRYHESEEPETFNLITQGVRVRHDLAVEFKDEIWEGKTINAVAANFVHSLDAAHLVKVVNHANRECIRDIITVYDCYYCLAPRAEQLIPMINYELYEMYRTRDVLADLRDRNAVLHEHTCGIHCSHTSPSRTMLTSPQRALAPRLIPLRAKDAHDPLALIFSAYAFS